jgi:hypothetical protein
MRTIVVFITLWIIIVSTPIQAAPSKSGEVADNNKGSLDVQSYTRLSTLSEDRQILERQADRQYDGIEKLADRNIAAVDSLITKAAALLSVIVTMAGGLFIWMVGSSRKELREDIRQQLEKDAERIIAEEKEQFRSRFQELQLQIDNLTAYKTRQVTWVSKPDEAEGETIENALYAAGVENLNTVTPQAGEIFELGEPDLVVLSFNGTDEARRKLRVIVDKLKSVSPPIPLLIFTFNAGANEVRLDQHDREILKGFNWWIPVNFPAQLLAQTQLLIRREWRALGEF